MKTKKFKAGYYISENNYVIIKVAKGWNVLNEVTGEVLKNYDTKKEAVNFTIEAKYIKQN